MNKPDTHYFFLLPILVLLSILFISPFGNPTEPIKEEVKTPIGQEAYTDSSEIEVVTQSSPPCNCTLTQGGLVLPMPFLSGNTSAANFYSYSNPLNVCANTGLETSETLLFMLYEDQTTGVISFVFIFDQPNDGTGGNADISFNCIPGGASVGLSDDPGEFAGAPPTLTGNFNWAACCTDGGIIDGIACGDNFSIDIASMGGIDYIQLVSGTPGAPSFVPVPQSNCPMMINCGATQCCEAFEFNGTIVNASCSNSEDGEIYITTDCASAPTFLWSNGATTQNLTGVNPGAYTVTITDLNGCTDSDTYEIESIAENPYPNIIGPTEFCSGDLVELGVDGFYTEYQWSNGSADPSILVTMPDTYTVTVTNGFGCTGTASTTIEEFPVPEPEILGPPGICLLYDTVSLDAGAGYVAYQWSNGASTQTIDIFDAGGYFVTVTNSYGCTAFDFHILDPLPNPEPDITGPESLCAGNSITLDAGPIFSAYQWSNGSPNQTITTNMGGTYIVTVTDFENCLGIDSVFVNESQADTMLLYQTSCNPQDTGVFEQLYVNQYGCDSLEILTINYAESDSIFLFDQSCNPQDTGIFIETYTNQYGCDSVEIETVALLEEDNVFLVETSCSPQDTGITIQHLTNLLGCDSTVVTTTTLLPSDTVQLFEQSCDQANVGVTEELLVNSSGCDSLVITTTNFILADTTYLFNTTCDETMTGVFENLYVGTDNCDSLVVNTIDLVLSDTTYLQAFTCDANEAGESEDLETNQGGCDSLVITNTILIPPDTTLIFTESCDPGAVGVFEEIEANVFGCDSFLITSVSLLPTDTVALFETSCDPNQEGVEEELLVNVHGCDSLVIITTSYSIADSTQIYDTTCDPASAGVFEEILTSTDGCDSVVTTTISLLQSDVVEVVSQSCDPTNVGVFEELFTNQFGCDSLVITTVELLPSDTTTQQINTCDVNQPGITEEVLLNQYGCDSLIITTYIYVPPDTTQLFFETCDPAQSGMEEVYWQNTFGCDSLVVITTTLLPTDTTTQEEFSCDPDQVGTTEEVMSNIYGCDSLVITETLQLPSDTTWLIFGSCLPSDTGLVANTLVNQYGCDSLVLAQTNLLPAFECQLNALIIGDTIGCQETTGTFSLTLLDGTPPYEYNWTDQLGNGGSGFINQLGPQQVNGLPPGIYTFKLLDANGLESTLIATIFQPDPLSINLEVSSDFNGYNISCFGALDGSAEVAVLSGGLPPYTYIWSNGSQTTQANNLPAGMTTVTVMDATSCEASQTISLGSPDVLQFGLSIAQPDCFSEGYGAISIDQVTGGNDPYQFAIDGNNWQANSLFENLASGNYLLSVTDANGCTESTSASINPYIEPVVDLGPDSTIQWGESIELRPIINIPLSMLDSIYWAGVDCPGCPEVVVAPLTSSNYSITVVDSLGCEASDNMNIHIKKDFDYFIPNAFSPNLDGINDHFYVFSGPHVVKIRELQVFDRWGEPVFTGFNLPPNDLSYAWDGTHRGEELNPAVFVFFTVLEFVDGSTKMVKGDVMLMK